MSTLSAKYPIKTLLYNPMTIKVIFKQIIKQNYTSDQLQYHLNNKLLLNFNRILKELPDVNLIKYKNNT